MEIIKRFIEQTGGIEQHSDEWYNIRSSTLGGSEIATVIGVNPYSNLQDLIAGKLGITNFVGNKFTTWGTQFEPITSCITSLMLDTVIYEVGSIQGVIEGQRYSPDGIGVVTLLDIDDDPTEYIVLFEFKSPMRSILNTMPKHYEAQVQTGLLSVPITDLAIFISCGFRKCTIDELKFSSTTYDKIYHSSDFKKKKNGVEGLPYALVILSIVVDADHADSDIDYCLEHADKINYCVVLNPAKINNLEIMTSHNKSVQYECYQLDSDVRTSTPSEDVAYKFLDDFAKSHTNLFYFKLQHIVAEIEERDEQWEDYIRPYIANMFEILNRLRAADNPYVEYYKWIGDYRQAEYLADFQKNCDEMDIIYNKK